MTSRLKHFHLSDFSGGLVTNEPVTEIKIEQSSDLDNINLLNKGFEKRRGDNVFNSTAMNSGATIQGLSYYRPVSGVKYAVAIAGTKIFKSDNLDGTMDDITDVVTITAGKNNTWTECKLNDLQIFVGGAPDAPIKWSGAGNAAVLDDTPPSGKFCFQMRDRVHIGGTSANPNRMAHCVLADATDWSGTGSGTTDVVTNDGDILMGGLPLNNDVALIFKRQSIHFYLVGGISNLGSIPVKPFQHDVGLCGKLALVYANGLVYFINNEPKMKATDGYSVINFPNTIDDIWDDINKDRLEYIVGQYYPQLHQIHWYVSKGSTQTTNNYAIIWDIERNCWLRASAGFNVNAATLVDGYRLFGGHYNGKLYEKDFTDKYYDDSETSPGIIKSYWYSKWINGGDNLSVLHPRYMDVSVKAEDSNNIVKYSYGFDYSKDLKSGQFSSDVGETGGKWGVDRWADTFVWGAKSNPNLQPRIYMLGRGNNFQLKFFNDVYRERFRIDAIDVAFSQTGVKEITNV